MGKSKVPFAMENISLCICPNCPVQSESKCVNEKMENISKTGVEPNDVPGLYCSSGVGNCKDIDSNQMCICGGCPIWKEFELSKGKPLGYFCIKGEPS